ncbi:MAG TPA: prepilin-type N-terminal cleavage/methylation domain-containing protein [Actinoplanes sp.]
MHALAPGRDAGFSLIEVLVAMVILAVGLLAIEAMAIGAARQIASANHTTEYTLLASEQLETQIRRVRALDQDPQAGDFTVNGARVQVVPTQATVAGVSGAGGTLWTIAVTVTPPSTLTNVKPVTVTARAFK